MSDTETITFRRRGDIMPGLEGRTILNRGCWFLWGALGASALSDGGSSRAIGLAVLAAIPALAIVSLAWEIAHGR